MPPRSSTSGSTRIWPWPRKLAPTKSSPASLVSQHTHLRRRRLAPLRQIDSKQDQQAPKEQISSGQLAKEERRHQNCADRLEVIHRRNTRRLHITQRPVEKRVSRHRADRRHI